MGTKEQFIQDLNQAFANGDTAGIMNSITDDITWEMVGNFRIEGKEEFQKAMAEMENIETLEMKVNQVITHGKLAATDGNMRIREASGEEKAFGFCDIYEFNGGKNAKIRKMISYVVPLKNDKKIKKDESTKDNTKSMV